MELIPPPLALVPLLLTVRVHLALLLLTAPLRRSVPRLLIPLVAYAFQVSTELRVLRTLVPRVLLSLIVELALVLLPRTLRALCATLTSSSMVPAFVYL